MMAAPPTLNSQTCNVVKHAAFYNLSKQKKWKELQKVLRMGDKGTWCSYKEQHDFFFLLFTLFLLAYWWKAQTLELWLKMNQIC